MRDVGKPHDKTGNNDVFLVIPAYNPDDQLLSLLDSLEQLGFKQFIIVNDGSSEKSNRIFAEAEKYAAVLLHHETNRGKGAALKTAFNYYLEHYSQSCLGVITLDADGQHSAKDVQAIYRKLQDCQNELVLGVRSFSRNKIPLRSRIGNQLTRKLFKAVYKLDLIDTQTGLRGIPNFLLSRFAKLKPERYDFEMNCLLEARNLHVILSQVEIETIYLDKNISSHFNPVLDSLRIYFVFFRFAIASTCSFLVDITLFALFHAITADVYISTYVARVLSGYTNFQLNRKSVFKSSSREKRREELVYYVVLSIFIALSSSFLVDLLKNTLNINIIMIKIFVDSNLFLVSFLTQKYFIFPQRLK
jgi:glycosyltransferase involved in cell wall biosynthesis